MPVYVDRTELRNRLNAIATRSDAFKRQAGAIITDAGKPLGDDDWDTEPEGLYLLYCQLADAAEAAGETLKVPINTEEYREQILRLPLDLRDQAEAMAKVYEIPNVAYPGQWNATHAEECARILDGLTEESNARLRRVHAILGAVALNDDEQRHAIIKQLTGGEEESSRGLTAPEVQELERRMLEVEHGTYKYAGPSGLVDAHGEMVGTYAPDWSAFYKANGLTKAKLQKLAKAVCGRLGLPDPTDTLAITGRRETAAIMSEARTARATEAVEEAFASEEPVSYAITRPIEPRNGLRVVSEAEPAPEEVSTASHPSAGHMPNGQERTVLIEVPVKLLPVVLSVLDA